MYNRTLELDTSRISNADWRDIPYDQFFKEQMNIFKFDIKKVIFNEPATIVFWGDGTKTVVKDSEGKFDPEKGLAMAISKKALGNKGNYYDVFRKWLPEEK